MRTSLRSFVNAILGKTGKPGRLDTATRMAMEADFSNEIDPRDKPANEPLPEVDALKELERILRKGIGCATYSAWPYPWPLPCTAARRWPSLQ